MICVISYVFSYILPLFPCKCTSLSLPLLCNVCNEMFDDNDDDDIGDGDDNHDLCE